ncbi:HelD family protein [Aciditerrimonas ferrireducens]|uniref:HelD family protein n=1 Tax=Aciditerrimonas ferrireducens TaxID=667306 RepID=UPI00200656D5|nr:AAA family ATPase [Aciditerrimonas ferrireducens]MCK4176907.1 AAA family ATPase [Aciditerrimonas ferrireducens]
MDAELAAEQAHVDRAYRRLEELRREVEEALRAVLAEGRGGTHQFREERDVIVRTSLARLQQLDLGDQALCFGRIDRRRPDGEVETFHIGRLGVSDRDQEPLVVDWRAPVAEPFYRATGRDPMGLVLRRHLAAEGRRLVGLEDERFEQTPEAVHGGDPPAPEGAEPGPMVAERPFGGPGALLAALDRPRAGAMRDIVATIQAEQDEIVRAPLPGVLVVQGGPGTGKTAVALHRAAYLLYTHRFPLERQGVLVIGPNPLFLRYIDQVLPSLGETGVTLSTVSGLLRPLAPRAEEPAEVARLKGDPRMATVIARAVRQRQRPLRRDLEVPFGSVVLRLGAEETAAIVASVRRRPGTHNARRRVVEQLLLSRLADRYRERLAARRRVSGHRGQGGEDPELAGLVEAGDEDDDAEIRRALRRHPVVREALDRMWPRLSAEELVHDLLGAPALLAAAGRGVLSPAEVRLLVRPRARRLEEIPWTEADLALVDEAEVWLGPRRPEAGEARLVTYGHIVVDEAQDLSPMQLRMVARRSLSGSLTVVGDIGQATGPWAPASWDEVTAHLPAHRPPRVVELTVSYRTPAEVLTVATPVLRVAAPGLEPPVAARRTGVPPRAVQVARPEDLGQEVAKAAAQLAAEVAPGTTAVLVPSSLVAEVALALDRAGVAVRDPRRDGLGGPLSLLPVDLANGLEFDAVVLVEPGVVVGESPQGLRGLYVALTRPTRRLTLVHHQPLPEPVRQGLAASWHAGGPVR